MNLNLPTKSRRAIRTGLVILCAFAIGRGDALALILLPSASPQTNAQAAGTVSAGQLDSLVAPIALYPDPLLAQVLASSTYPQELVQLQQFLSQNSSLTGQALAQAVTQQPWDPSVQAMAAFPDVVTNMTQNIQWTTDLGNAFLAQESGVMDAVQRMRARAQASGQLQSTPQQVVETQTVDNRPIISIEQADPNVVYVPTYDPTVVYGAAPAYYPYPSEYYPSWYSSSGYWAGRALAFGTGIALGSWWGGGGWGWNPGWGRGDISINRNNAFVRHSNFYRGATGNVWRHNAARAGVYGNRGVATTGRYGNINRGNYNRATGTAGQFNRGNYNRATGQFNRGNYNRGTGTTGQFNRGNYNRATGTTGNFNRGNLNRPAGTTGMTNRPAPGSFNRAAPNFQPRGGSMNRNFGGNRGSFNSGSFNRGSFNRGNRGSFGGGGRRGGGFGGGGRRGGGGRGRR
jgi:hypothetical protein